MRDVGPVLVTGGSGHLGANLVRALLGRQRRVRALVRGKAEALDGLPVERVQGDVLDPSSLARACAGVATVFHLAGKVSAGWEPAAEVRAVNVTGTQNVVDACRSSGVGRLVHMSSIQALRPAGDAEALDETSCLVAPGDGSRAVYDLSKADAERLLLASAGVVPAIVLNPTGVLGPYDFQRSPMGRVLLSLALGNVPALVRGAACDFVDARDVADAALAAEVAAGQGRAGNRYILSGTRLTLVELARTWAEVTGRPAPRIAVPMALARLGAPVAPWLARLAGRTPLFTSESLHVLRTQPPASHAKATRELAFSPRPLEETLRDTWAWMKSAGWS